MPRCTAHRIVARPQLAVTLVVNNTETSMPSPLLQRFFGRIVDRLTALTLGGLAAQSEADAAINEAECLERLEAAARQYEAAGKPHLAERLRRRAALVNVDDPGSMATASLARLGGALPEQLLALPTATNQIDASDSDEVSDPPPNHRRRRSAKRETEE